MLRRLFSRPVRRLINDWGVIIQYRREKLDRQMVLTGALLASQNLTSRAAIADSEFSVFSQFGEDGIIQHILSQLTDIPRTFVEIGCSDFEESNTKFLMMKDNWQGFVVDGNQRRIKRLQRSYYYWKHSLVSMHTHVDAENVQGVIAASGFENSLGLLSIDIDGNDYHLFSVLEGVSARILVVEFNPLLGNHRAIVVPYRRDFDRYQAHSTGQYWGASLAAWEYLANSRGYDLVATTSASNNAFFVHREANQGRIAACTAVQLWRKPSYRDSKASSGEISFDDLSDRIKSISGLPVLNVVTNEVEQL